LAAAGLQEACSFSLVAAAPGRIPLANPLLADYGYLRDNLHGELRAAADIAARRGRGRAFFEPRRRAQVVTI
jgi:hypothetical protein